MTELQFYKTGLLNTRLLYERETNSYLFKVTIVMGSPLNGSSPRRQEKKCYFSSAITGKDCMTFSFSLYTGLHMTGLNDNNDIITV